MKHIFVLSIVITCFIPIVSAKPPIVTPPDVPVLGELDAFIINKIYKGEDREGSIAKICDSDDFKALVKKHNIRLFGGPVVGSVTDTSAKIWVRTVKSAEVQVTVGNIKSEKVTTKKENDLVAVIEIRGLKPFTKYTYDVLVDGSSVMGAKKPAFKTFPSKAQKAKFNIGFGGGARYNHPKEKMWDVIASQDPIAFLFLGDNLYIDDPLFRNRNRAYYYRRQLRPEYQRLSSTSAIYAIWDDHDFGKNDCAGGPEKFKPDWKLPVWKVFCENWPNPYFGGGEKQPGCWFDFSIGDVDFFMTDGRYYRAYKQGTMLGPVQKKWLLEKLKASKATFKVIASGTLWTETADKGGKDSWWGVKAEQEEILSTIDREKIGGVILLSADRHRTDVYEIKRPKGYSLYEFESSKLTNNHTHGTKKQAIFSYNKGNYYYSAA